MLKLIVLLTCAACAFGAKIPEGLLPQLDGRIVGGTPTSITNHPFQASLQKYGSHICGCVIIASNAVLTAAHCVTNSFVQTITIRAGSTYINRGGDVVGASSFVIHPGYTGSQSPNDIAIVRLSSPLSFDANIQSIPLVQRTPSNGEAAVVTGWGTIYSGGPVSDNLQMIKVYVMSAFECRHTTPYGYRITSSMLCAAAPGKDSCQGDSGGPLVVRNALAGIVSWGWGCAGHNQPGVYTDVFTFTSWIRNNV